jgi:hypothetical protein
MVPNRPKVVKLIFVKAGRRFLDARRWLEFLVQLVDIVLVFEDDSPLPDTKQREQNQGGG